MRNGPKSESHGLGGSTQKMSRRGLNYIHFDHPAFAVCLTTPRLRASVPILFPPCLRGNPHAIIKPSTMRHLKLTIAYDGASFHGWQIQPGPPTIHAAI